MLNLYQDFIICNHTFALLFHQWNLFGLISEHRKNLPNYDTIDIVCLEKWRQWSGIWNIFPSNSIRSSDVTFANRPIYLSNMFWCNYSPLNAHIARVPYICILQHQPTAINESQILYILSTWIFIIYNSRKGVNISKCAKLNNAADLSYLFQRNFLQQMCNSEWAYFI